MIMVWLVAILTAISKYNRIGVECWAVGTVEVLVWISNRVSNGFLCVGIFFKHPLALKDNFNGSRQICDKFILLELCEVVTFVSRGCFFYYIIFEQLVIIRLLMLDVCGAGLEFVELISGAVNAIHFTVIII